MLAAPRFEISCRATLPHGHDSRQQSPHRRRRRRHVHRRDPASGRTGGRRSASCSRRRRTTTRPSSRPPPGSRAHAGEVSAVVHGTTVATNAVLERRGALTALVTTAGFRDVLELRRLRIPHMYDPFWRKPRAARPAPPPLRGERARDRRRDRAPRRSTRPRRARSRRASRPTASSRSRSACSTRTASRGTRRSSARSCARSCRASSSRSRARSCASSASTSARATTVVNAYVRPLMERYVAGIRSGLDSAGIEAPLTIMQSSGGVMTADDAGRRPVLALESGPGRGRRRGARRGAAARVSRTRSRSTWAARPPRRR